MTARIIQFPPTLQSYRLKVRNSVKKYGLKWSEDKIEEYARIMYDTYKCNCT